MTVYKKLRIEKALDGRLRDLKDRRAFESSQQVRYSHPYLALQKNCKARHGRP